MIRPATGHGKSPFRSEKDWSRTLAPPEDHCFKSASQAPGRLAKFVICLPLAVLTLSDGSKKGRLLPDRAKPRRWVPAKNKNSPRP